MTAKAYILLRTAPGLTKAIYSSLKISPAVRSVEMITGPYDLIVSIEAATTEAILRAVMEDIRPAAGVRDTVTCLVVPGEHLD
ncbi:MAG: Lrp/AsnC ligand binding domain-containing protein [Anaerolineae bacterium]|jgi:DNA-binding Lrp family transcriptional regulator|nr:Lrp/AsnC ligand binding domain-containing protein [Anaerolineae bacterium]